MLINSIFTILSLSESARNLQQNYSNISHRTLEVFLHYLAKYIFVLWKLEVIWRWCVKYARILLFLIFYISQGRTATYLRCRGKCYIVNVANFLLSSAVNEFLKLFYLFHSLQCVTFMYNMLRFCLCTHVY